MKFKNLPIRKRFIIIYKIAIRIFMWSFYMNYDDTNNTTLFFIKDF